MFLDFGLSWSTGDARDQDRGEERAGFDVEVGIEGSGDGFELGVGERLVGEGWGDEEHNGSEEEVEEGW